MDLRKTECEMNEYTCVKYIAKSVWYKNRIPVIRIQLTIQKRDFFSPQVQTCSGKYSYALFYPMFFPLPNASAECSLITLQLRMPAV
jgi:hypothetical protein